MISFDQPMNLVNPASLLKEVEQLELRWDLSKAKQLARDFVQRFWQGVKALAARLATRTKNLSPSVDKW